ncbi:MAG TPA: hypothetical protein VHY22_00855 [Chthoniobacteraceae bacterium]|nr:hypothetical protein [Chthoniobacteraceae bacterium]
MIFRCALFAMVLAGLPPAGRAEDCNATVLREIGEMPVGGGYGATRVATIALVRASHYESGRFFVLPSPDSPSFCSGATYLVFLKTIEQLRRDGRLKLDVGTLEALVIEEGQRDGEGIWGRWNANGPGTARLFYELRLGPNFTDVAMAKPGDFMKIFWTAEVGAAEHGHSVVFLGTEMKNGEEYVRFWSSNIPNGYGEKSVARSKMAQVIFSRLETPENLERIETAPATDPYLASLLTRRSSFPEALAKCGM